MVLLMVKAFTPMTVLSALEFGGFDGGEINPVSIMSQLYLAADITNSAITLNAMDRGEVKSLLRSKLMASKG
jgi:hypothetical protein